MKVAAPFLVLLSLLASCVDKGSISTFTPVCDALVKPYTYNSFKPSSRRHAGIDLVIDLKQHNQIYKNLGCPTK